MSPFEQALCREMHTFDALWHEIHLTLREIPLIFARREAVVFLCLAGLTLIALDPHDFLEHISVLEALFVWTCADVIFALVYFVTLLGIAMAPTKSPPKIYLPIPSIFAFTVTTVFVESMIGALSLREYTPKVWPDIVAFVAVAQLFEFLFVRYVLPDVLKSIRENQPKELSEIVLQIGDQSWPLAEVSAISSNQHYLQVDFVEGVSQSIRARISDVLEVLPPAAGVQPHRSWWVAAHAHPSLISEGRKRWLITPFGHKIPVARGRIDEVEKWLNTYGVPESNLRHE